MKLRHSTVDKVGAACAGICLIHCIILPVAASILPLIGLTWLADEKIEIVFLSGSAIMATTSICYGFKKHRRMYIFPILASGIAFMAIGHIAENTSYGLVFAVTGGLVIIFSHITNYFLCKTCNKCNHFLTACVACKDH